MACEVRLIDSGGYLAGGRQVGVQSALTRAVTRPMSADANLQRKRPRLLPGGGGRGTARICM